MQNQQENPPYQQPYPVPQPTAPNLYPSLDTMTRNVNQHQPYSPSVQPGQPRQATTGYPAAPYLPYPNAPAGSAAPYPSQQRHSYPDQSPYPQASPLDQRQIQEMEDAEMARKLQEEINNENPRQPMAQNASIASAPTSDMLEDGLGTNGMVQVVPSPQAPISQTQLSEAMSKLLTADSIQILTSKSGHGKMGFEIRPNNESFISMFGSEDSNMINGFSLKVLTLGLVNTKFSLTLNSHGAEGSKVLEILRPIGMSEYIEVWLSETGSFDNKKRLIGYVRPTSFKLTRIQFAVCGPGKVERGRMQSYALRGLFNDGYEYVQQNKAKGAKMDRSGLVSFNETGKQYDLEYRLLLVATGMLIKFNI